MKFAEDFEVGDVHDLGEHEVTSEEIITFAKIYDPQPYHISAEAGCSSFFGGLVASGWNVASIWMRLYVRAMLIDANVQGSPGVDALRWNSPVRPGDVLQGNVEILDAVRNPFQRDVFTLRKRGTLKREGEKREVMSLVLFSRFVSRLGP